MRRLVVEELLLHRAASEGHRDLVELLIANGADVNAKEVIELPKLVQCFR